MNRKLLIAGTALSLCLGATGVMAGEEKTPPKQGLELSREAETPAEQRAYHYEFDRDEQCQGYALGVKRLGIDDPCGRKKVEKVVEAKKVEMVKEYVVYFDFDDETVREDDKAILQQAANEITQYNPDQVIVVGHADTKGSAEYNEALSARRANAVSEVLTSLGVNNFVLDKKAKGEMAPAVPTADGVKLQENRFVSVQFLR